MGRSQVLYNRAKGRSRLRAAAALSLASGRGRGREAYDHKERPRNDKRQQVEEETLDESTTTAAATEETDNAWSTSLDVPLPVSTTSFKEDLFGQDNWIPGEPWDVSALNKALQKLPLHEQWRVPADLVATLYVNGEMYRPEAVPADDEEDEYYGNADANENDSDESEDSDDGSAGEEVEDADVVQDAAGSQAIGEDYQAQQRITGNENPNNMQSTTAIAAATATIYPPSISDISNAAMTQTVNQYMATEDDIAYRNGLARMNSPLYGSDNIHTAVSSSSSYNYPESYTQNYAQNYPQEVSNRVTDIGSGDEQDKELDLLLSDSLPPFSADESQMSEGTPYFAAQGTEEQPYQYPSLSFSVSAVSSRPDPHADPIFTLQSMGSDRQSPVQNPLLRRPFLERRYTPTYRAQLQYSESTSPVSIPIAPAFSSSDMFSTRDGSPTLSPRSNRVTVTFTQPGTPNSQHTSRSHVMDPSPRARRSGESYSHNQGQSTQASSLAAEPEPPTLSHLFSYKRNRNIATSTNPGAFVPDLGYESLLSNPGSDRAVMGDGSSTFVSSLDNGNSSSAAVGDGSYTTSSHKWSHGSPSLRVARAMEPIPEPTSPRYQSPTAASLIGVQERQLQQIDTSYNRFKPRSTNPAYPSSASGVQGHGNNYEDEGYTDRPQVDPILSRRRQTSDPHAVPDSEGQPLETLWGSLSLSHNSSASNASMRSPYNSRDSFSPPPPIAPAGIPRNPNSHRPVSVHPSLSSRATGSSTVSTISTDRPKPQPTLIISSTSSSFSFNLPDANSEDMDRWLDEALQSESQDRSTPRNMVNEDNLEDWLDDAIA
jgi:hypothetical protein